MSNEQHRCPLPVGVSAARFCYLIFLFVTVALSGCGDDTQDPMVECTPGDVTLATSVPEMHTCGDRNTARLTLTNDSCEPVQIRQIQRAGTVLRGPCQLRVSPTLPAAVTSVDAKTEAVILDFTGNQFCCAAAGCTLSCTLRFDFAVVTDVGTFTSSVTSDLLFDEPCDVVCG